MTGSYELLRWSKYAIITRHPVSAHGITHPRYTGHPSPYPGTCGRQSARENKYDSIFRGCRNTIPGGGIRHTVIPAGLQDHGIAISLAAEGPAWRGFLLCSQGTP